MSVITPHTSRAAGTILTASVYNADHLNHIANITNNRIVDDFGSAIIAPTPSSLNKGIAITQSAAGVASGGMALNSLTINDTVDVGAVAGKIDGLYIQHHYGGGGVRGGRHGLEVMSRLTAATSATNPDRNYVGAAFVSHALSSDGGGVGTEKGAVFGINAVAVIDGAATNMINLSGGEINIGARAGSSVVYKSGLQIVAGDDDAVAGSVYDCMLAFSNQTGAIGWKTGILVGSMNGAHPIQATGKILATVGSATVGFGVDISSYTITTAAFKSPGFSVNGTGSSLELYANNASIELGSGAVNTPFIDFRSSGNAIDYDARIIATGGSGSVGTGQLSFACASIQPAANDGVALGTATISWSDLFLASGGVINWSNSNVTITHAATTLTFGGAASGYVFNDGAFNIGSSQITTGSQVSTGDIVFDLGGARTGSGHVYLDMHSVSGTDYETRIIRSSGANGEFAIQNTGIGDFSINQLGAGALKLLTTGVLRMTIAAGGGTDHIGLFQTDSLRVDQTPTTVTGAGPIAIGSASTINKRISIDMNGTTYWLPASTTAF